MTETGALELGKKLYANITNNENNIIKTNDYIEFVGITIKALEEIQQYRGIDTQEKCRAAVEKQKTVKPMIIYDDRVKENWCSCRTCSFGFGWKRTVHFKYCPDCGQKLDWSE